MVMRDTRHLPYFIRRAPILLGIPGARDNELPPSQTPVLLRSSPAPAPSSPAVEAARAAEAALATVEAMWARGGEDPSPATCRAALDACAAGGQWERALALVRDSAMDDMKQTAPGGGSDGRGLAERVERLALEGRWSEALSVAQPGAG